MDDAFIGFQYIDNFLGGFGLTFNAGERIEGVTNIGWLLLLIPFAYAIQVAVAAKIVAFVLIGVLFLIMDRLLKQFDFNPAVRLAIPAVTAFSFCLWYFSFSGMETSLAALILMLAVYSTAHRKFIATGLLLGALFSVRPETVVILPLWAALMFMKEWKLNRDMTFGVAIFGLVIVITELLRYIYFGDLLPNTFYSKNEPFEIILSRVLSLPVNLHNIKNIAEPFNNIITLAIMGFGVAVMYRIKRETGLLLLAISVAGLAFSIYAREDWTGLGRYFAPYEPVSYMLFFIGLSDLFKRIPVCRIRPGALFVGVAGAVVVAGLLNSVSFINAVKTWKYPWYIIDAKQLIEPAKWIANNTPEDSRIATRRIGCLAFYSDRYIFDDKFGLTDKAVALAVAQNGVSFNYPDNPFLKARWGELKPTHILEDSQIIDSLTLGRTKNTIEIHSITYGLIHKFTLNSNTDWELWADLSLNEQEKPHSTRTSIDSGL